MLVHEMRTSWSTRRTPAGPRDTNSLVYETKTCSFIDLLVHVTRTCRSMGCEQINHRILNFKEIEEFARFLCVTLLYGVFMSFKFRKLLLLILIYVLIPGHSMC